MPMPRPIYQTSDVTLYQGDALALLRQLPSASVHCCITSPPYWGLRSYNTTPQVWDGEPGCRHVWGDLLTRHKRGKIGDCSSLDGGVQHRIETAQQGAFCRRCNAWQGDLGLEPTPELFVSHLVAIFREVHRVLRDDGVLWLNLGDSYATGGGKVGEHPGGRGQGDRFKDAWGYRGTRPGSAKHAAGAIGSLTQPNRMPLPGLKPLDLVGIPWRVAFALQADGWYLRSDVIWHKPNPMPESVQGWRWERHRIKIIPQRKGATSKYGQLGHRDVPNCRSGYSELNAAEWADCPGCPSCTPHDGLVLRRGAGRLTKAHEYVFLLTKTDTYFYDSEAVKEPCASSPSDIKKMLEQRDRLTSRYRDAHDPYLAGGNGRIGRKRAVGSPAGRNRRSVWTLATQPFKGHHFATFPPKLVEPMLLAGTSAHGCCAACGAPWVRVVKPVRTKPDVSQRTTAHYNTAERYGARNGGNSGFDALAARMRAGLHGKATIGYRPTCPHDAPVIPCTVLDPFAGTATTGLEARQHGRRFIGLELNPTYLALAITRLIDAA